MGSSRRMLAGGLLAVALASLVGSSAVAADAPSDATDAAEQAFAKGSALFAKRDYLGAVDAFEEAYRLRPHFMVQCNIARCHEWSGNFVQAAERYRRCLNEGARGTKPGERAEAALKEAEARITWVRVESPGAGGTIYVDGQAARPAPGRVPINPGTRVLEVRRPNTTPASATLKTRGGEQRRLTLVPVDIVGQLIPGPGSGSGSGSGSGHSGKRARLRPVWFWATAAASAAFAIAATGMGIATLKARSSFEEHPTEDGYQEAVNRRLITNVFWGIAAAAAGASTALFFYTDFSRARDRRAATVSLGVQGRF